MSELIQVRKKSQVTLPQSVRKELGIKEGDYLDIQVRNGEIVLRAKALIDKQQAWFWSESWQQGEAEAQDDIRKGRTHKFSDAASAIDFLHGKASKNPQKADKSRK
jgi:AbrB family looped-hinge helix DNA binding protein